MSDLREALACAVELFGDDPECITPGTDAYTWLAGARAALAATAAQAQGAEPPPGHYTNAMKVAPEPPAALQDRLRKGAVGVYLAADAAVADHIAAMLREAADALDRLTAQADALRVVVKAADAMRGEGYEPRPSVAKVQAYDAAREKVELSRDKMALAHRGQFARLNFPTQVGEP